MKNQFFLELKKAIMQLARGEQIDIDIDRIYDNLIKNGNVRLTSREVTEREENKELDYVTEHTFISFQGNLGISYKQDGRIYFDLRDTKGTLSRKEIDYKYLSLYDIEIVSFNDWINNQVGITKRSLREYELEQEKITQSLINFNYYKIWEM